MSGGNNHAKQIVIEEAEKLAAELQNGGAGDPLIQGRAISLIVKMVTPLYQAEFVTVRECQTMHDKTVKQSRHRNTRLKIGPIEIEGPLKASLILNSIPFACVAALTFVIGRTQQWW